MLDWKHVDLDLGAVELAADEEGRKPGGSWRVVPLVAPLRSLLRREWLAQGRPKQGKVLSAASQLEVGPDRAGDCPKAGPRALAQTQGGADRLARVSAHGSYLARSRGRLAKGRLADHGTQDARVSGGRGHDHLGALHGRPAGRVGAGPAIYSTSFWPSAAPSP